MARTVLSRAELADAIRALVLTRDEWAAEKNVGRRTVDQWPHRFEDFPAPLIGPPRLDRATMYYRPDVDAFHERHPGLARR